MKPQIPSLAAAACLLFFQSAQSDVLVLRNGERVEGDIVAEDQEKFVVEVKVSASIRDEKIIPRSEVVRIERQGDDEKAFASIAGLVPAPELLAKEGYEVRIETLEDFIKDHPSSSKVGEVKRMIDVLQEELMVVSQGGIKLGEEMVAPGDYDANAYGYDARILEKRIKEAVAGNKLLVALRMFDGYEEHFGEAEGRPALTELMLQVLAAYRANVTDSLNSLDSRLQKRETGLERMTPEHRAKIERAILEENENIAKRLEMAKASRMKWVTPHPFHKDSMEDALRQVTAEIGRLEGQTPAAPETPLAEVYRDSWQKLTDATDEEKAAVIEDAKAKRLPEPYLVKLRERAGIAEKTE